jgi:hypothetical protein
MNEIANASLLRRLVQEVPSDVLGVEGEWNWRPDVDLDYTSLAGCSPTTGTEGGED